MNELLQLIKGDEGYREFVYDDATGKEIVAGTLVIGNPTIGYGRLLTKGRGINNDEAEAFLDRDLQETLTSLINLFPWFTGLDSVRADVVVSMAYNMGVPTFRKFKNTIAAIESEQWDLAAREILDSKAARQLPARYMKFANMMKTGQR